MYNQFRVTDVALPFVWNSASFPRRGRWAIKLASAFTSLETLGFIPTKACVRGPVIDRTGRLKLVGFSVSPSPPSAEQITRYGDGFGVHPTEILRRDMQGAYQRLASCLHYIPSGTDLDEEASGSSASHDLTASRKTVLGGGYPIAAGLRPIADILQAA
ncbi:hypothetical protein EKO27_g9015 [Xylaria grammica]|uniref:Uncharacterized protein n=1 Tax=Xylaria grammica TaxID=363999 RepID=A0A439CV89_9PEZI|nr:hypothetical protein EKO27_g9015 [Xylaria grammica]